MKIAIGLSGDESRINRIGDLLRRPYPMDDAELAELGKLIRRNMMSILKGADRLLDLRTWTVLAAVKNPRHREILESGDLKDFEEKR